MTRKDYLAIAEAIRKAEVFYAEGREAKRIVAESVANALAAQSRGFDRELFLRNCGVEV